MAVSKPILVALVGAILAAVAFYGTQGMRTEPAGDDAAAPARTAAKPAPTEPVRAQAEAAAPGVPAAVLRASERNRVVVLFFFQRGADDKAVRKAVASLAAKRNVSIFDAPISKISDYHALTGELGIAQAPSVVVIGKRGASVVEGYVDEGSLAQEVADAR